MLLGDRMSVEQGELIFVYVGRCFPKYAQASLILARKTSGIPIRIISNEINRKYAKRANVTFTALEDFYSPTEFERAKDNILSNSQFRDGLWVKSLERFFILYQYAQRRSITKFLHAELDQGLFNIQELSEALDSQAPSGLFVPFHSENAAVASIFYCNNLESLKSLLDYASFGPPFLNEMVFRAEWAKCKGSRAHRLPTIANQLRKPWRDDAQKIGLIQSSEIHGIVDAAQLGQWIGGIDPRNVDFRKKPLTKFVDLPSPTLLTKEELTGLKFSFDESSNNLYCHLGEVDIRVYNLHLHSKIHRHLVSRRANLKKLFLQSNESKPYSISGTRKTQILYFLSQTTRKAFSNPSASYVRIKSEINFKMARRKSSYPFLSGDTFRDAADHLWENEIKILEPQNLNDGDVIFCESELFEELKSCVLERTDKKCVLVLGNSDHGNGPNISSIGELKSVSFVFAQNLEHRIEGVEVLPIGLENAWRSNFGRVQNFKSGVNTDYPRINRIMWSFNVGNNVASRLAAKNYLQQSKVADFMGNLSAKHHRNALKQYKFVAAPPGNGLDTHRMWEAIYLGCIPIVLHSYMTVRFLELGIPALVINSFEEVCQFEEKDLAEIYQDLMPSFNNSTIWAPYWIDQIRNRAKA